MLRKILVPILPAPVSALVLALALASALALPSPSDAATTGRLITIREAVYSPTRVRTLDCSGDGDYSSLAAALTDLETISSADRNGNEQWVLQAAPCPYTEPTGMVVPRWVTVQCTASTTQLDAFWGDLKPCRVVAADGNNDLLRLGDSSIVGFDLQQPNPAPGTSILGHASGGGFLAAKDLTVHTWQTVDSLVSMDSTFSDRMVLDQVRLIDESGDVGSVGVSYSSNGPGWVTGSYLTTSGAGGGTAVDHTGTGDLTIVGTTIEDAWTTEINHIGSGTLLIGDQSADQVPYTPSTPGDWTDPDPSNTASALDDLAERPSSPTTEAALESNLTDVTDVYTDLDNMGFLTSIPNGTETSPSVSWAGSPIGFYQAANIIRFTTGSTWVFQVRSNAFTNNQRGGITMNPLGLNSPTFAPDAIFDADTGLGGNGSGAWSLTSDGSMDLSGHDNGLEVHVPRVDTPSTVECPDTGDATVSSASVTPQTSYVEITNLDADGCNLTLSEPAFGGLRLTLALTSSIGGIVTLPDTPGFQNLSAPWTPGVADTLSLLYTLTNSEWVETARSDN